VIGKWQFERDEEYLFRGNREEKQMLTDFSLQKGRFQGDLEKH